MFQVYFLPLIDYFSNKPVKIINQWQVINLKHNQSMASNKPEK
jgi:hypothetical protein